MESQPQNPEYRINPENFRPRVKNSKNVYQKGKQGRPSSEVASDLGLHCLSGPFF